MKHWGWLWVGILVAGCGYVGGPSPMPDKAESFPSACTDVGQVWTAPGDGASLICVPAGEFLMGAEEDDPAARDDEKPVHRVTLAAFWIDQTEVTNARFAACVEAGGCHERLYSPYRDGVDSRTRDDYYENPVYADYPVLIYDADEAAAYCEWAGRRLPTEAEWEKAARGSGGGLYPWGKTLDCRQASYFECVSDTTRVDFPEAGRSPYGALNMSGNVWEWVADWYVEDYYRYSPAENPTGPDTGVGHVRRGGGWRSVNSDVRVTARASGNPQHYFDGQMGFRCAVSAP